VSIDTTSTLPRHFSTLLDTTSTPPTPLTLRHFRAQLAKLKWLNLCHTQITDAGCAALAAALESGALPAILDLYLSGILASDAAQAAVRAALATSKAARVPS
jgi:hypothetical protein